MVVLHIVRLEVELLKPKTIIILAFNPFMLLAQILGPHMQASLGLKFSPTIFFSFMNVVQETLLESKVEIQTCDPCVNRTPQAYYTLSMNALKL
jgi:hypothetical protein